MRIRLTGKPEDVDLASEILCVLGTVASVSTYPSEDVHGHVQRYVSVTFLTETMEDLGVIRTPSIH